MANNVTEVFRVAVPSVGLVLKARADIDGKQDAFVSRVKEDAKDGEADVLTEYSANMDCVFNFNGGEDAGDIRYSVGEASVKAMPVFFETRYFLEVISNRLMGAPLRMFELSIAWPVLRIRLILTRERSLGRWISSMSLGVSGWICGLCFLTARSRRCDWSSWSYRLR